MAVGWSSPHKFYNLDVNTAKKKKFNTKHTISESRDVNSQARVHQVLTLECSKKQNFSHGLAFPV